MKFSISGCADYRFPVVPYYGLLWYTEEDALSIPMDYPLCGRWGDKLSANAKLIDDNPSPIFVSVCWLSLREERFYFFETDLNQDDIKEAIKIVGKKNDDICFILGMGAMGKFSLWLNTKDKSVILKHGYGETTYVAMEKFMPIRPDLSKKNFCNLMLSQIETQYERSDFRYITNIDKQYLYRYIVLFEHWNGSDWEKTENHNYELLFVENSLIDGTHDKLHDDSLFKYHKSGCPERIVISIKENKIFFEIYLFIDKQLILIFERFYGAHPDTKTDFIIRIDAENKKYELALYRQGLKEPVIIPESAYQLIVFKNKFEDYRSENYNQPRGAWIW